MQARFIRNILIMCMGVGASYNAGAQNASRVYIEPNGWAIGVNAGSTDLFGDIGTQTAIEHYTNSNYLKRMAFMGGMFARYTIHPALCLKMGLNYGSLYATDKWNYDLAQAAPNQGTDAYQRYARGQNARTIIFESYAMLQISPTRINPESKFAHKRGAPYIGFGIGLFHYTPYSTVATGAQWVKSYDLDLEGQGWGGKYPEKESLWQPSIPICFGWRWDIGEHLNLGIEYCYRKTFTDYLDGVSGAYVSQADFQKHLSPKDAQIAYEMADKSYFNGYSAPQTAGNLRGNPSNKDSYSSLMITFYYKINTRTKEWWH